MTRRGMETLSEALARLEQRGFRSAFRATSDGVLELDGETIAPEALVVEETVRFEGESDPEDEAVLFALRSQDGRMRGTFVAAYGPQMEPACAAVIHRLPPEPGPEQVQGGAPMTERRYPTTRTSDLHVLAVRNGHPKPADMTELLPWVQEAVSAEHFVRKCTEELLVNTSLTKDMEASLLVRGINDRAGNHIGQIEALLSALDEQPSALRQTVGEGLGAALGWMERLPSRDLIQVVRDVYVALNYTAAGYHVLYTRSLLLERPAAASLALEHLRDYTPAIRQLSQLLAWASALELPLERWHKTGAMREIVATLFESWSGDIPFDRQ